MDKLQTANEFNRFFTSVGADLSAGINSDIFFSDYLWEPINNRLEFVPVVEQEVNKIIDELNSNTSCSYDGISTNLLKQIKPEIIKPLTKLINKTIQSGVFPDKLKIAKVIPIFKKDSQTVLNNYRPISILPALSKVFEKVIFRQTNNYFSRYGLYNPTQYGFRSQHSTELAVLKLMDKSFIN